MHVAAPLDRNGHDSIRPDVGLLEPRAARSAPGQDALCQIGRRAHADWIGLVGGVIAALTATATHGVAGDDVTPRLTSLEARFAALEGRVAALERN